MKDKEYFHAKIKFQKELAAINKKFEVFKKGYLEKLPLQVGDTVLYEGKKYKILSIELFDSLGLTVKSLDQVLCLIYTVKRYFPGNILARNSREIWGLTGEEKI